ncbi:MAG: hypothetical protein WC028_16820 [Candidatus Obscuribacterales bacterium]
MPFQIIGELAFGNTDSDINCLFEKIPEIFFDADLLITLQEAPFKEDYPITSLLDAGIKCRLFCQAMIVEEESIPKFPADFFFGFAELYMLKPGQQLQPFELNEYFTTDCCNFSKEVPKEFLNYFEQFNAIRFLADGVGLNYVCEPALAAKLESLFTFT